MAGASFELESKELLMGRALASAGIALVYQDPDLAIVYTDLLRTGGWPQVGAVVAIMGIIDAFFAPRILKRAWDEQDRDRR